MSCGYDTDPVTLQSRYGEPEQASQIPEIWEENAETTPYLSSQFRPTEWYLL